MRRWFVALLPLALAWARTENEEVPTSFILEHDEDEADLSFSGESHLRQK